MYNVKIRVKCIYCTSLKEHEGPYIYINQSHRQPHTAYVCEVVQSPAGHPLAMCEQVFEQDTEPLVAPTRQAGALQGSFAAIGV